MKKEREFERITGWLCLDFANTVHHYGAADPEDDLVEFADFTAWAVQSSALPASKARFLRKTLSLSRSQAFLEEARQARKTVYSIFSALASGKLPSKSAVNEFNRLLSIALRHLQLKVENQSIGWKWNDSGSDVEVVLWKIVESSARLLDSTELLRVRECAGAECTWLFVDKSKNGSRRWCDMKNCGNREKSRRHYAKKKLRR